MKTSPIDALSRISLFAGLEPAARVSLAARLDRVSLGRGEVLFREGDLGAALYLVQTGEVRVLSDSGSREVCRLGPTEHVGEMSLIDNAPRSATVVAGCDTTLWRLDSADFDALCVAFPQVHKQIAAALARRLRDTTSGSTRRRAEAVVLFIDVRTPTKPDRWLGDLITGLEQTVRRPVAVVDICRARHPTLDQITSVMRIESPEGLSGCIDELLDQHAHVILLGEAASTTALMRAAYGRAELTMVLLTASEHAIEQSRKLLDGLSIHATPGPPPVELIVDRRDEQPRGSFVPIDQLAAGRVVHTVARTPGYSQSGSPDFGGFGRVARRIARRRVGLAMGGGGARAFAHVGVIAALERAGVPVDVLAGTSGGAIVAGLAARDWDSTQITDFLLDRWTRRGVVDWTPLPWTSLLRGRKLERIGSDAGAGLTLEELTRPFVAIATDLVSGEAVALRRGDGWTAVRASLSVPGVFPPVRVGNQYLVDGGAINNLPAEAARQCGADMVIGINVSPPLEPAFMSRAAEPAGTGFFDRLRAWRLRGGLPLFRIIYRTISVQGQALQSRQGAADFTLSPDVSNYDMFEFNTLRPIIEIGRLEAEARMAEIQKLTGPLDNPQSLALP